MLLQLGRERLPCRVLTKPLKRASDPPSPLVASPDWRGMWPHGGRPGGLARLAARQYDTKAGALFLTGRDLNVAAVGGDDFLGDEKA
jgi:hypothetical protein